MASSHVLNRTESLTAADAARSRAVAAGPIVAVLTLIGALVATDAAGVAFRDPDHVAAGYILEVGAGVALLIGLDILLRAGWRGTRDFPSRITLAAVRRERWTRARLGAVAAAIVSFYVTYLAYRNLKAVVPLLRPEAHFDAALADADRTLFFGHDPATVLHDLLGTGVSAHALSSVYVAFIVFLPLSLGLYLVFSPRLQESLLFSTALSVNWVLGIGSYFLLPSLGPAYSDPGLFASLPHTEVTHLQQLLMQQRIGFLHDPDVGTPQAIAAFASLHIAMSFSAVLAAYLFGVGRRWKQALWAWLGLTLLATTYLGWHFFVDDLAGLAMGAVALAIAIALTGFNPRAALRGR